MARFSSRLKTRSIPKLEPRITAITALVIVILGVAVVRLYYLQIIKHHQMAELANRNRIRIQRLPAMRGLVFDSHHRPLVDTRPSFDAVVVPEDARNLSATIAKLQQLLGDDKIGSKITEAERQGRPPFDPVTVKERLDWSQVVALETHQLGLPGVTLRVEPRRHYIYGTLAAHLLGYVGDVSERDLARFPQYQMGDQIGKFGLERAFESVLRGQAGGEEIEVDSVGRRLRMLRKIPEQPGDSVVMTIDLNLQEAAEQAIGDRSGALVAIDPNTGYILAMVSHPAFNPNMFANGITAAEWHALMSDPEHPMENRAIQGIFPPGSTFKIVDTIAGLEDGTLKSSTHYFCPGALWFGGRWYRCWRAQGHGNIDLHNAIVQSCDVFFYNVGERLGVDRIAKWAHALGLGHKTGIDLSNESAGIIPSTEWKERYLHQPWYPAETLSVAIGQGYVAVTPLQLADLAAEVANGGTLYKPQFVKEIQNLEGDTVKVFPPIIERQNDISAKNLAIVRSAMADVVNSPLGTGHGVKIDGVTICGKTGTAQVVDEAAGARTKDSSLPKKFRDDSWFMAFAPENHPTIAIACVLEHAGEGASAAGPVVHQVLQRFFELYPPPSEQETASASHKAGVALPAHDFKVVRVAD